MKNKCRNDFFIGAYDFKSLPDALDLVSRSLNVIFRFKADIWSIRVKIQAAPSGVHGFIPIKSFVSLELVQWFLQKLLENISPFGYYATNPLSIMTFSVEHFH